MHTDSAAKLNSTLSVDSHCVLNPQRNKEAVELLFNVLCAVRNAEYILALARIYIPSIYSWSGDRLLFITHESKQMCMVASKSVLKGENNLMA